MLGANTARNPEFDYDRLGLADMDNPECKASYILKNRQSITACSLLRLFLLTISYFNHAGPENVTKQHFCKILEENSVCGVVSGIGNIGSKSAEFVEGSDVIVTFIQSLRRTA